MKFQKRKRLLFIYAALWVVACDTMTESPEHSPGLRVAMGECMNTALAKPSVDSTWTGLVKFQSRDSIHLTLSVELNCEASYAFEAKYRAPDTLAFTARDVGDMRSKCMCRKDVTFEYRASDGENLATVKFAKWESRVMDLRNELNE